MWTIAKVTLREAMKKKILILIAIVTLLYLGIFSLVLHFVASEGSSGSDMDTMDFMLEISVQVTSIIGFYFSSMLTAFMTILLSTGAVSADLDSGVLQAVLARPLSRWRWFCGKYSGYAIITASFATFLYGALMLACSIFGMPFMKMVTPGSLLGGWFLFVLEPLVILSLSLWLGIRLRTVAGAILVGGIFVISMIGSFIGQIGSALEKPGLVAIGWASVFVAPFDALYKRMTAVFYGPTDTVDLLLMIGDATGMTIGGWIGWYALGYIALFLGLGVWTFQRRDM